MGGMDLDIVWNDNQALFVFGVAQLYNVHFGNSELVTRQIVLSQLEAAPIVYRNDIQIQWQQDLFTCAFSLRASHRESLPHFISPKSSGIQVLSALDDLGDCSTSGSVSPSVIRLYNGTV